MTDTAEATEQDIQEEEELDETSAEFIDDLVLKLMTFVEAFCDVEFFPYQIPIAQSIIESIVLGDGEEKTLIATRQSGKALALDTPIPTPTGWVKFGNLTPGDHVFGADGQPVRVIARTPVWDDRPCYRVTFNDGTSIVADENHQWQMSEGEIISTKDLVKRASSRRGHGIDLIKPVLTPNTPLPVDPYVLGAWLGDGGSRDGRVTCADEEVIERIRKSYRVERKDSYGPYGYYIYGLSPDLIKLGVMDRHKRGQEQRKHIPALYLRSSYEDRVALLQGLMDTDGTVSADGRCEFCVTRKELALGVAELLRSLGIKVQVTEADAVLNGRVVGTRYRLHFSAFLAGPIPFHLSRKRNRLLDGPSGIARSQRQFVTSVERTDSVPVRCIQVEGGLFAAGEGWVITHNSEVVSNVIAGLMVILPKLSSVYPVWLDKFKKGFMVGVFAPTEEQADTVFGRVVSKLTSDHATNFLLDPEIDDKASAGGSRGKGKVILLKNSGSLCRMQTCNPKAKIESKTYHFVFIDEAQEADESMIMKSIRPMLAFNNGSLVLGGTAQRYKSYFYNAIQRNKRRDVNTRSKKRHHHEYDWRTAAKYNSNYAKFIAAEKLRIGEDSDEFQMSYCAVTDTPILMADLTYIPAGKVSPGMRLVGFDEERPGKGVHRRFKEAVVLESEELTMDCYSVTLSDGTSVTCTPDHRWLVLTAGRRTEWKRTDALSTTDNLHRISPVWDGQQMSYEVGYLAAAFDGEGCLVVVDGVVKGISFAQRDNAMLSEVKRCLDVLGFRYKVYEGDKSNDVFTLHLRGGRAERMRFLGTIRPLRLLSKFSPEMLGTLGRHDFHGEVEHPRVVSVDPVGPRQVMAIKTTERTYIAAGLASHNCNRWMLEKGMFVTEERLDRMYDHSMPLVHEWYKTPIVVGIDVARSNDSTVITAVWVDWDRPDPFGFYEHRVLNWHEINNVEWEQQYFDIIDFIRNYDVLRVGVDAQGVGGAVAERLQILLPNIEVVSVSSDVKTQNDRWTHLTQLIQREQLFVPGDYTARRTRRWKKFNQQMAELERVNRGPYMLAAAPDERGAFDDYADSLAIACHMTTHDVMPVLQVSQNPFFR